MPPRRYVSGRFRRFRRYRSRLSSVSSSSRRFPWRRRSRLSRFRGGRRRFNARRGYRRYSSRRRTVARAPLRLQETFAAPERGWLKTIHDSSYYVTTLVTHVVTPTSPPEKPDPPYYLTGVSALADPSVGHNSYAYVSTYFRFSLGSVKASDVIPWFQLYREFRIRRVRFYVFPSVVRRTVSDVYSPVAPLALNTGNFAFICTRSGSLGHPKNLVRVSQFPQENMPYARAENNPSMKGRAVIRRDISSGSRRPIRFSFRPTTFVYGGMPVAPDPFDTDLDQKWTTTRPSSLAFSGNQQTKSRTSPWLPFTQAVFSTDADNSLESFYNIPHSGMQISYDRLSSDYEKVSWAQFRVQWKLDVEFRGRRDASDDILTHYF